MTEIGDTSGRAIPEVILARTLGPEDTETISVTSNLGICLRMLGRYNEAELLIQEVLEIQNQVTSWAGIDPSELQRSTG